MIRRFDYGAPLPTEALVKELPLSESSLPYFTVANSEEGLSFTYTLGKDDLIYGLGETVRGINKRGHIYRSWNTDEYAHHENKQSLYASHNLLIFHGSGRTFGVFFDDPGEVIFDLGYTKADTATITSVNGDLRVILIGAPWMTASLVLNNQLRFQGSANYAMVGIVSGAILNIALQRSKYQPNATLHINHLHV